MFLKPGEVHATKAGPDQEVYIDGETWSPSEGEWIVTAESGNQFIIKSDDKFYARYESTGQPCIWRPKTAAVT